MTIFKQYKLFFTYKFVKMPFDVRFKTPFNCMVIGPSSSGKTTWVRNFLKFRDHLMTSAPKKVILFYNMEQLIYNQMKDEGLINEMYDCKQRFPVLEDVQAMVSPYKNVGGSLVIFDDMLTNLNSDFERLFLNLSHHENASCILLSQNMFYKDKVYRTMSLNTHYMVLMKNGRDVSQCTILAKQFCPTNVSYFIQAFLKATRNPYSYLILDFRSDTPPTIKLRYSIFPHEFPMKVALEN